MTGEWVLVLPFTRSADALSLNQREHWRTKSAKTRLWREATAVLARQAKIPACERILVELHFVPPQTRRRDPDNLVASLKPAIDGLVDARVVPDDTAQFVQRVFPIIHRAQRAPIAANGSRYYLRVQALTGGADSAPTNVGVPTLGGR